MNTQEKVAAGFFGLIGGAIALGACAAAVYFAIRFIHWAWMTPLGG